MKNIATLCYLTMGGATTDIEIMVSLEQAKKIIEKMKNEFKTNEEIFGKEYNEENSVEYHERKKVNLEKTITSKFYELYDGCHLTRIEIVTCKKGYHFKEEYIKEQRERY